MSVEKFLGVIVDQYLESEGAKRVRIIGEGLAKIDYQDHELELEQELARMLTLQAPVIKN